MKWGSRRTEQRDLIAARRLAGVPGRLWFVAPGGSARFDERTGRTLRPIALLDRDGRGNEQDH